MRLDTGTVIKAATGRSFGDTRVIVPENVPDGGMSPVLSQKVCEDCLTGYEGYGLKCGKCRKAAYRKRQSDG